MAEPVKTSHPETASHDSAGGRPRRGKLVRIGLVALILALGLGGLCYRAMLDLLPALGMGPFGGTDSTSTSVADASSDS